MSSPPPNEDDVVVEENEGEEVADGAERGEEVADGAERGGSPVVENVESEKEYVVEKILDQWLSETGDLWYLIKWEGYDDPNDNTWEPFEQIKQCTDIIATWEARKAARGKKNDRKRSRSATAGDESGSGGGRNKKKSKTQLSSTTRKRRKQSVDGDDDSDDSGGTNDSFMNELKEKNEGTFNWIEDIRRGKSDDDLDSDVVSLTSLADQERTRRKSRKEQTSGSPSKSRTKTGPKVGANVVAAKAAIRPSSSISGPAKLPHLPFSLGQPRSLNAIKPAKRKHGQTNTALRSEDRRPMSLSQLNSMRKKQREELPPDPTQITIYRPNAVLTSAGRTMRAGVGFDKAVGDVETAISLAQKQDSPPLIERKEQPMEKTVPAVPPGRRKSVTEALAKASKIQTQESKVSPILAMIRSPESIDQPMENFDTAILADAWLNPPLVSPPLPRSNNSSSPESHAPIRRPAPPSRRNSTTVLHASPEPEPFLQPSVDVMPTVPEDSSRIWTGELLYSKDLGSFGTIRLLIPESSIRIPQLPNFAGPSICLKKLVSARYLNERWLSMTAHPSNKPDCLIAEFAHQGSQKALVRLLQQSDSAALVIEESCTLIFFFKQSDRLRPLFNVDSSSGNPIGVALLNPLEALDLSPTESCPMDDVRFLLICSNFKLLSERRLLYTSILSYNNLESYIKDDEHHQFSWYHRAGYSYVLHSPPESLETDEMEAFLYSRGGYPSDQPTKASVVLINRLYQHCLNYIPNLTALKRRLLDWPPKVKSKIHEAPHKYREVEIYLFGSYLDYQMEGNTMRPVFGNGLTRIFPGGGIICFTIDYLLNSKLTWSINFPESMLEKMEHMEKSGASSTGNFGDVLVAIALIREQIADKRIKTECYQLDGFGVNSYMPFMNFLQNRECESMRRFVLVHPQEVSGGQWDIAGNGIEVYTPQQFDRNFRGS